MNEKSFDEILLTHRNRLYSTAFYVLRDPQDAEDVVQEAFLRLWRFTGRVDPQKIPAWLSRVVHNLCMDQGRRRQASRRNLGVPDPRALETLSDSTDEQTTHEQNAELRADRKELLDAMTTLNPESRSILIMHYFQGLKLAEIAEIIGLKTNSVKVKIHRARRALRLVLDRPAEPLSARRETG